MEKMTKREFYTAISTAETLPEEIKTFALSEIAKIDDRNAKRVNKPSKTALANIPLKEAIFKYLSENDGKYTEAELGTVIEATHNKAGALVRQLVKEGKVSVEEIKVPKVGKRKAYFIAK